jgi:tyrosine-specific transport protein
VAQQSIPDRGHILSAIFLVAGTCIGGGMLALPIATGVSGFIPSLVMMVICWLAMTASALLLLEVCLWMENEDAHVISMASRFLGLPGKVISWALYLFICYASIIAYTAGGGVQIASFVSSLSNTPISMEIGCIIFVVLFGGIIYLGSELVGRANTILFLSMIAAYVALVGFGLDEVKAEHLQHRKWSGSLFAVPLLLTSFSFQTMVPSLTPYLHKHAKALRWAILGGTTLALLVYVIWQWLILGIVPVEGPNGLGAALAKGEPATQFINEHVEGLWIASIAEYFAFFAIITSFFGIALGLFDFLSDGLGIKKEGFGKVFLGFLLIVPTVICAAKFERIFLVALDTSGGFGDTILNGLIPVLMVWIGRYQRGYRSNFQLPGGKFSLCLLFCFFLFALGLEIVTQTGYFSNEYKEYELFEKNIPEIEHKGAS